MGRCFRLKHAERVEDYRIEQRLGVYKRGERTSPAAAAHAAIQLASTFCKRGEQGYATGLSGGIAVAEADGSAYNGAETDGDCADGRTVCRGRKSIALSPTPVSY
jgi:hypothetical protein